MKKFNLKTNIMSNNSNIDEDAFFKQKFSENRIFNEMEKFLGNRPKFGDYYFGITNNVFERLSAHKVPEISEEICSSSTNFKMGSWFYYDAFSPDVARYIEDYYTKNKDGEKMKGYGGGGTDDTTFVYCYKIIQGVTVEDTRSEK